MGACCAAEHDHAHEIINDLRQKNTPERVAALTTLVSSASVAEILEVYATVPPDEVAALRAMLPPATLKMIDCCFDVAEEQSLALPKGMGPTGAAPNGVSNGAAPELKLHVSQTEGGTEATGELVVSAELVAVGDPFDDPAKWWCPRMQCERSL